jgi:hypothetical protein
MKKSVLILSAVGAMGMLHAQTASHALPLAGPISVRTYHKPVSEDPINPAVTPAAAANHRNGGSHTLATTETVIGNSTYTMQTNSSTYRRTSVDASGNVSAAWIFSAGAFNTWSDRGTGYNYYNGSAWGAIPTARTENSRVGFTDLAVAANGREVTVAHDPANNAQHLNYRTTAGTGTWTDDLLSLANPPGSTFLTLWPRMAVSGNDVYYIGVTEPTANGGAIYHGQDGALCWSKSTDGGATWSAMQVLAAVDSTQSPGLGGDAYAIDAQGNTVAIVVGGFGEDLVLAKSTDGGTTWTKTIVHDFAMPAPYDGVSMTDGNNDGIQDTLECNDASVSVVIDNNGMCHVFYGDMFITSDGTALSYFPGTAALMYWNEGMGSTPPVQIEGAEDLNANGTLDVTDFGTYQVGLVSHPSAGVDASGNIYVAYSSIMEGTDDGTGKSFRNIYCAMSSDGGATWTTGMNVAPDLLSEKVYPMMTRNVVGGMIRMTYEVDQIAGHGIGSNNPDTDNAGVVHDIVYASFPVTDLQVGIAENNTNLSLIDLYPNPSNTDANLAINMNKAGNVTINIVDVTGATVSSTQQNLSAGQNVVALGVSNLSAGIYFVNVTEGTATVSRKLVIE